MFAITLLPMWQRRSEIVNRLMLARIRFGALGGVPLSIHWTWFPFVVLLSLLDRGHFTSSSWRLAEILALFAIVLLHEIGYFLAARWRRVSMREIVLIPLGGFAIGAIPSRWKDEFLIVAAGPMVNALLVPVLYLLFYQLGYARGGDISLLLWHLLWLNNVMLVFNLLPIWPLDGGRLVQSLMSAWIGISRSRILVAVALAESAQRMLRIERKWACCVPPLVPRAAITRSTGRRDHVNPAAKRTMRSTATVDAGDAVNWSLM